MLHIVFTLWKINIDDGTQTSQQPFVILITMIPTYLPVRNSRIRGPLGLNNEGVTDEMRCKPRLI